MPVRALAGATRASTAGSNDSTWMPTESTPMSPTSSMTSRSRGGSNWISTGSPEAVLDGLAAPGDVAGAAVDAVGAAGRQRGVDGAVELLGGAGDLGQLLGALLDDGASGVQRDPDAAERALVVVAPVGAGLHHRAGERVQVQQADLPVGDAVGGGQVVEPGAALGGGPGEPFAVPEDRRTPRPRPSGRRGSPAAARVVRGHRDRDTADPQHPGVRRARRLPAAARAGTSTRRPRGLQVHDQGGELRRGLHGAVGGRVGHRAVRPVPAPLLPGTAADPRWTLMALPRRSLGDTNRFP